MHLAFDAVRKQIDLQRNDPGSIHTKEQLDLMWAGLFSSEPTNVSVASFTEMGDQLSQWRGYSEIGKGYSLGFDGPKLKQVIEKHNYSLAPCVYKQDIHKLLIDELVSPHADPLIPRPQSTVFGFAGEMLFIAPLIKSAGFEEEKEWRLITHPLTYEEANFRQGNHSLIPYWEIDVELIKTLKLIIIGPTPEPSLSARALNGLLIKKDSRFAMRVQISQSEIPFRKI